MAVAIQLDQLATEEGRHIAYKIKKELELDNGKAPMRFYRIDVPKNRVYLPYYYARLLQIDESTSFQKAIKTTEVHESVVNMKDTHKPIQFNVRFNLNARQIPVMKEVLDEVEKNGSVFLKACTGFGKSIAIMYIAQRVGFLTLIFATNVTFITQLANGIAKATEAVTWIAGANKKIPNGVQIIITSPGCFKHIPVEMLPQIGCVIIDEAHLICTPKSIIPLLSVYPRYVVACSATIERTDGMHVMLQMLCGPKLVVKSLDTPVRVIKWNTGIQVPIILNERRKPDWSKHISFLSANEGRNNMIADFCADVLALNVEGTVNRLSRYFKAFSVPQGCREPFKIIIMLSKINEWIEPLKNALSERKISHDYLSANKKRYRDCSVLFGTPSKLGTGFDQEMGCDDYDGIRINVVIDSASGKHPQPVVQKIGRGCRASVCYYVPLVDDNPISRRHYVDGVETALEDLNDVEIVEIKAIKRQYKTTLKLKKDDTNSTAI